MNQQLPLTRAQQRVVLLAIQGHTNRQIAETLHLTVSTVEQHLTHSYRKLGIQHRTQLEVVGWRPPHLEATGEPTTPNPGNPAS